MDITLKKFSDLAESIANRRDLSDEALKKIWESKPKNPPIQEGQTLVQQSYIRIDDTYGAIDDEDDCLVYDSQDKPDSDRNMETISQVIERLQLMHTTIEDDFLNLTFEVTLKVINGNQ